MPAITTELGGKGANAVFPDADLEQALAAAVDGAFGLAGQNCCAASRLLVHQDIYDEFIGQLTRLALSRRLGDQFDDTTEQGPQIDRAHVQKIDATVRSALVDGARAETGATATVSGLHYKPTVLTNVSRQATISHKEVFDPAVCAYPFRDLDEAIEIANDSSYGLSASVWTKDTATADQFATLVKVGTSWVNCFGSFLPHIPWGGVKLSGNGRELGGAGISEYLVTKAVYHAG